MTPERRTFMEKKSRTPKFVKSDSYTKYYANSAKAVRTPWDISLVFGQSDTHSLMPEGEPGLTITDGVEIVMSYQHLLSLYNLLKGHVDGIVGENKEAGTKAAGTKQAGTKIH
jgi:hypothetical protein